MVLVVDGRFLLGARSKVCSLLFLTSGFVSAPLAQMVPDDDVDTETTFEVASVGPRAPMGTRAPLKFWVEPCGLMDGAVVPAICVEEAASLLPFVDLRNIPPSCVLAVFKSL